MIFETPVPGKYSAVNALELAYLASFAYDGEQHCELACRTVGATQFQFIRDGETGTECFVCADDKNIIVAFRGTKGVKDLCTDARILLNEDTGTHEGFSVALNSVWFRVSATVREFQGRPKNVFFTGHSLGGALAMLAANYFSGVDAVYTFGQPRVGNAAFTNSYDARLRDRTFRLVDKEDPIPRIPWLLGKYRHAGTEVFFNEFGGMEIDPPLWRKIISDALGLYRAWRACQEGVLADHAIQKYLDLLHSAPSQTATQNQT